MSYNRMLWKKLQTKQSNVAASLWYRSLSSSSSSSSSSILSSFSSRTRFNNNTLITSSTQQQQQQQQRRFLSINSDGNDVIVSQTLATNASKSTTKNEESPNKDNNGLDKLTACGDLNDNDDDDDEMEQEEMFVDPHETLGHTMREWGGPTRGGRLAEPTRFGDWERKGRCTDF